LPRLIFQNGGIRISAAQEGAGGMRGGFFGGAAILIRTLTPDTFSDILHV